MSKAQTSQGVLEKTRSVTGTRSLYFKDDDDLPEHTVQRDQFEGKWHSLFFYIGNLVGPGNILRFPYCTLMNGGVVFMLMYTLALVIVGIPVTFMEYSLGQYSGKSAVKAWDVAPAVRGVGFSCCLMSMSLVIVYHVFMAYCALFAFNCFQHTLPWAVCKPIWNNCYSNFEDLQNLTFCTSTTQPTKGCICSATVQENCTAPPKHASVFYFRSVMTGLPETRPEGFGLPNWDLVLILIGSWTLLIICSINGIARNTSKILPITVLGPYCFLILLLIKAATQYGAADGMLLLFHPKPEDWNHMLSLTSWLTAATLSLFSLSTGDGSLITYGSYNQFNENPHRNVLTGAGVDLMSSLLCCVVVALVLGHYSHLLGDLYNIKKLTDMRVLFEAFPAAMATYKWSNFWSFIFFFMCYLLTIDTEFAILETLMAYLQDDFSYIKRHSAKTRIFCCILFCLIDILLICEGGHGFRDLLNHYTNISLPLIVTLEVVTLMWIYGYKKWLADMEYMIGHRIGCGPFLFVKLNCLLPLLTIFIAGLMKPHRRWGPHDGTNPRRDRHTVFADIFHNLRTKKPARTSVFHDAVQHEVDFEHELDYFFGPGASSVFMEKRFSQPLMPSLPEVDEDAQTSDSTRLDLSVSVDTGRVGKHTSRCKASSATASSRGRSPSQVPFTLSETSTEVDPLQPAHVKGVESVVQNKKDQGANQK
ncbi:sodium-dependent proline transporter-like isoform X2 [Littorina saxatilis]|uniref:sodium-dependent proline transporter-like isoform X2 n=1 Tax=Littorina saxatilis TaxID=31220 RepID=UPI0038B43905